MQLTTFLVGCVMLSIAGLNALAHPASNLDLRDGAIPSYQMGQYTVVPTTLTLPVLPGGPNLTFTGKSLVDIKTQIMALNPEYDMTRSTDYEAHNISASSYRPASNRTEQSRSLVARNRVLPQNCYCPGVNPAPDYETFIAMVDEWNTYDIRLTCGGGPRTCITLLCSANGNGNGVFLCNDNLYSIAPSLIYLLDDYAIPIGNFCGTQNPPHSIIGQMFDTDNYNVIVGFCPSGIAPPGK